MELREYQQECLNSIIAEAKQGVVRQIIVLATGCGKTVIFGHLPSKVRDKGKKTLILAHREELLTQARDKILRIDPTLKIGIEQGINNLTELDIQHLDVIIASVPTLGRSESMRIKKFNPEDFGLIIIDECFVAGTKIDGRSIENIKVGDYVNSFNEKTKKIEKKKVLRLFKNKVNNLIKINLSNRKSLICTPNHPFYVEGNWVNAINLNKHDVLTNIMQFANYIRDAKKIHKIQKVHSLPKDLSTEVLELLYGPYLFKRVQKGKGIGEKKSNNSSMSRVWGKCRGLWRKCSGFSQKGEGILFGVMQEDLFEQIKFEYNEQNKQKICLRKNEKKQSYEKSSIRGEDEAENERENILKSGWKWKNDKTASEIMESFRFTGRGLRVSDKDLESETFVYFFTKLLFPRYRNKGGEISYRNRWKNPQIEEMEIFRQEENGGSEQIRVDSIEVLERGGGRGFKQVCSDGYVYNFEVEGNNNYFANGILVHNCHHATSSTYVNILRYFDVLKGSVKKPNGRVLLGCTATPTRADKVGLDKVFDKIVFSYTIQQGIGEGYLSNIKAYTVQTDMDISRIHTRMGDFAEGELAEVINDESRNLLVVDSYRELANHSKALVFAVNVEHAEDLAVCFSQHGYKAEYVVGTTDKEKRKQILKDFSEGTIEVLVNVGILTEGYDEPSIETILMARPTKSSVLFAQVVGRGTRLFKGKKHLNLIDFVDNTGKHSVMGLPSLFGLSKNLKGRGRNITEIVVKAEKILEVNPSYDVESIEDWSDLNIEKIIKRVDILAHAELPAIVKSSSKYAWHKHLEGYKIQFPVEANMKEAIVIMPNMLNRYTVTIERFQKTLPVYENGYSSWKSQSKTGVGVYSELFDAFKNGDSWIRNNKGNYSAMMSQSSKWRGTEPSEKQIKFLKKQKIPIPKGLTKGLASNLIAASLGKRKSS